MQSRVQVVYQCGVGLGPLKAVQGPTLGLGPLKAVLSGTLDRF